MSDAGSSAINFANGTACWPEEIVYYGGNFVGFIMALAPNSAVKLHELTQFKLNHKLPSQWKKWNRSEYGALEKRIKLAINLAALVERIICKPGCVLVDMKPENFLVTPDGHIFIIDTDSMQFTSSNGATYHAEVTTPEYAPPEAKSARLGSEKIDVTWDYFALSVIVYELMLGIHPFAATSGGKFATCNTIATKIHADLFCFGTNSRYLSVIPNPHQNFKKLPKPIRTLFLAAFSGKSLTRSRPSPTNWGETLYQSVKVGSSSNKVRVVDLDYSAKTYKTSIQQPTPSPITSPTPWVQDPADKPNSFQNKTYSYLDARGLAAIVDCSFLLSSTVIFHMTTETTISIGTFIIFYLAYFTLLDTNLKTKSLGKYYFGLDIHYKGQKNLGWRAIARSTIKLLSITLICTPFIVILLRHDRQGLHDLMTKTAVR